MTKIHILAESKDHSYTSRNKELTTDPKLHYLVQFGIKVALFGAIFAKNTSGTLIQTGTKFAYYNYNTSSLNLIKNLHIHIKYAKIDR